MLDKTYTDYFDALHPSKLDGLSPNQIRDCAIIMTVISLYDNGNLNCLKTNGKEQIYYILTNELKMNSDVANIWLDVANIK